MQQRGAGPALRYLEIVRTIAQREFVSRYRGNRFGLLPIVLVPVLFLATYTFVFSTLIPVRLRPEATRTDYAFFLFAGLVGWNLFSETIGRAPRLFGEQAHFVRKAQFPASALSLASCLSAFYQGLIWIGAFAAAHLLVQGSLSPTLLLAPFLLALLALFSAGVSLILASLGAFVRDLGDVVGPLLTLGMFLSPVFYPAERIAAAAPWLVELNPMAPYLELLRTTLLAGALPAASTVLVSLAWCLGTLAIGVAVHARVRPILADVV